MILGADQGSLWYLEFSPEEARELFLPQFLPRDAKVSPLPLGLCCCFLNDAVDVEVEFRSADLEMMMASQELDCHRNLKSIVDGFCSPPHRLVLKQTKQRSADT